MEFLHHAFSDVYARKDNWLTRIDVRIKLLHLVFLLTINLMAKNYFIPLGFLSLSFILLSTIKVPPATILRALSLPLLLAVFILMIRSLHEGEREWASIFIMGHNIVVKEEGLRNGAYACCKVMGGVSLVILFSLTTTISRLCAGLRYFCVSNTIVELLSFMYRYIFLFLDEVAAMWTAQKSRLGHASWKKMLQSLGTLGGMLIIRTFARSERTYEAMRVRGYEGGVIATASLPPLRTKGCFIGLGMVFVFVILVYSGSIQVW